jgi:hypothetical protein
MHRYMNGVMAASPVTHGTENCKAVKEWHSGVSHLSVHHMRFALPLELTCCSATTMVYTEVSGITVGTWVWVLEV